MTNPPTDFTRRIVRLLHSMGIEVTPEEVRDGAETSLQELRELAKLHGIRVPEEDDKLLGWITGKRQ